MTRVQVQVGQVLPTIIHEDIPTPVHKLFLVFEVVNESGENIQRVRLVPIYGSVDVQQCCMYYTPNVWGQSRIIP